VTLCARGAGVLEALDHVLRPEEACLPLDAALSAADPRSALAPLARGVAHLSGPRPAPPRVAAARSVPCARRGA
jgi:hypothetical protein